MENLEKYFSEFRNNILGADIEIKTPYGSKPMVYADWIASGRLYKPIEEKMINQFGPMVGNTHSEASETGTTMTHAYHVSHKIIKEHVNAGPNDYIITAGAGMTTVVNKLQRILGLKIPEQVKRFCPSAKNENGFCGSLPSHERPVVFVTHMEHHSNHTSWIETIADVVVIEPDDKLLVNLDRAREQIYRYKDRNLKIGAFSACSNVTGIMPPYYELAKIMHEVGGFCFVDFAASAPYVKIDMHPGDPLMRLDAIYFSPHKFLGGPGSSGVLVFNGALYKNSVPDIPGGGTVSWTNRWNEYAYLDDIEAREDGGTPGFIQSFRAALSIKLKEKMGIENIKRREDEILEKIFHGFRSIEGLHILGDQESDRIGVVSFYVDNIHFNLVVKILNDRFGIQVRGGCSCAGTYGHFLLKVDHKKSHQISCQIDQGDLSEKPGWVRLSIHPIMSDKDVDFIINAVKQTVENIAEWSLDYRYSNETNEFYNIKVPNVSDDDFRIWFDI